MRRSRQIPPGQVIRVPKGGYTPSFQFREAGGDDGAGEAGQHRRHTAKSRKRVYLPAVAVSLVCLAAFLLWSTGTYPFVRVPHSWTRNGTTLRILDARERLCWKVRLPVEEPAVEGTIRDKAIIADIDGDGRPEVLVNVAPREIAETGGYLECFEYHGRPRWRHRYGTRKTFGTNTFEPRYVGRFLRVTRAGVLAVSVHHLSYPAQAALLDPKTGAVREEYWHPGAFYECLLRDIDGDGAEEAILAAINNPGRGPGHAALAILKIPFSKAPRRSVAPGHEFPPAAGGGELAYVLFPLPDVARVMGQLPEIRRLTVDGSGHILVMTPIPEYGGIIYTLDFKLAVKSYQASDNFFALHERYYRQNLLDHALTNREFEALGKVVSFPWAPDGNHPDIGRFWRDAQLLERRKK